MVKVEEVGLSPVLAGHLQQVEVGMVVIEVEVVEAVAVEAG